MYTQLPDSPVRKIFDCPRCGNVSLYFYNPAHNRSYTKAEWEIIVTEGTDALYKILQNVRENPVFFNA
tara:strand:+ start:230 stop:433 length:204 start_codon:yes stop_codon:yes gene_type:complete